LGPDREDSLPRQYPPQEDVMKGTQKPQAELPQVTKKAIRDLAPSQEVSSQVRGGVIGSDDDVLIP
jgi:hypothetical protein